MRKLLSNRVCCTIKSVFVEGIQNNPIKYRREKMKRFKYFLIIVSVLLSLDLGVASAYEPAVQWQKTFGGDSYDEGYSVQQTSDGGYIIAGTTSSFGAGGYDVYLIKTDSNGNQEWQKTFGGDSYDWGRSVRQTSDGGYIIAGVTDSFGAGKEDVYLIKTDSGGNLTWQKTFGGTSNDSGESVQQTTDGGYIIAGITTSFGTWYYNVYLIKTDPNGNTQWQKTFGGGSFAVGFSAQQTSDGGYIIAGGCSGGDVYLIKTDSDGNLMWQKTFGGSYSAVGYSVQQTTDGGYIIAGRTWWGIGGPEGGILIKTDSAGDSQWEKTFGGVGYSVQQTKDSGYVIAGGTEYPSLGPAWDGNVYLIKTYPDGNSQWQRTFGGSYDDGGRSVQQTSDGGYIIAGGISSLGAGSYDIYLIKLSSEVCQYALAGDMNNDCKVDFYDFAIMAANWLIDCNIEPNDPSCVPK
jgi:hypothetical protein